MLADVAEILGYQRTEKAKKHLRDSQWSTPDRGTGLDLGFSSGSMPTLITEAGLYRLIMRSNTAMAKAFKKWVTKEVLPQTTSRKSCTQETAPVLGESSGAVY